MANNGRCWVPAHETAALVQDGCRIIEGLVATHGMNVEIPDFKRLILTGLMNHPLWSNTGSNAWLDWPSDCDDGRGRTSDLWAIIRRTFPFYDDTAPRRALVVVPNKTGRQSSSWMVTDDHRLMWATFELTFNDSRGRFHTDVEAAAQIMGAHSDAISVAMTEGLDSMWRMGESILNASIRFTDDIHNNDPATVKARFGWKSIRDATQAFQNACNASNIGTMAVGESLWDMYVDRLAVGGLVP